MVANDWAASKRVVANDWYVCNLSLNTAAGTFYIDCFVGFSWLETITPMLAALPADLGPIEDTTEIKKLMPRFELQNAEDCKVPEPVDILRVCPKILSSKLKHTTLQGKCGYCAAGECRHHIALRVVWRLQGSFFLENLQLEKFPFDTQYMNVVLESWDQSDRLAFTEGIVEINPNVFPMEEWTAIGLTNTRMATSGDAGCKTDRDAKPLPSAPPPEATHPNECTAQLWSWTREYMEGGVFDYGKGQVSYPNAILTIGVARKPEFYLWKVVSVVVMLEVTVAATFLLPIKEAVDVRMSTGMTCFLAIVAFQFTMGDQLPKIAKLTWLDHYFMVAYLLLMLQMTQVLSLQVLDLEDEQQWQLAVAIDLFFGGAMFLATLVMVVYLFWGWRDPRRSHGWQPFSMQDKLANVQRSKQEQEATTRRSKFPYGVRKVLLNV